MPTLLTTMERVKELVLSGTDTDSGQFDEVLDHMIVEASDDIEKLTERIFAESTYTHYFDGTGTDTLYLRQGPLVSITSLESIEYSDGGGGARLETTTTIDPFEFVEGGVRADGFFGAAFIRLLAGTFKVEQRNYKVVYVAGFVDDTDDVANGIPQKLVKAATKYVAQSFNLRDLHGLTSRELGDGSLRGTIPMANLDLALDRAIAPFVIRKVA